MLSICSYVHSWPLFWKIYLYIKYILYVPYKRTLNSMGTKTHCNGKLANIGVLHQNAMRENIWSYFLSYRKSRTSYVSQGVLQKYNCNIKQKKIIKMDPEGGRGPLDVCLCVCCQCPLPMQFFLGLSLALWSHDQFEASHWSTLPPSPPPPFCLCVSDVTKQPLPGVVETSGQKTYS